MRSYYSMFEKEIRCKRKKNKNGTPQNEKSKIQDM